MLLCILIETAYYYGAWFCYLNWHRNVTGLHAKNYAHDVCLVMFFCCALLWFGIHYDDVTMSLMASQITSLTIVYPTVYSSADQRKHQSPASLAFVRGIHRGPVNSPHKWPVTRKRFPFDDVIMSISFTHIFQGCFIGVEAITVVRSNRKTVPMLVPGQGYIDLIYILVTPFFSDYSLFSLVYSNNI